jgi:hypothetical protein
LSARSASHVAGDDRRDRQVICPALGVIGAGRLGADPAHAPLLAVALTTIISATIAPSHP